MAVKELRLLAYFVEIARAGSMRAAALRLAVTPPVVSTALSDLEQLVGATLITRSTRSMALTDTGQELFRFAAEMVEASEKALRRFQRPAEGVSGNVAVTLPVELATSWLPPLLRAFQLAYPKVTPQVYAEDAPVNLAASAYDIALRAEYRDKPRRTSDVCANLPLELVCAPSLLKDEPMQPLNERLQAIGFIATVAQTGTSQIRAINARTGAVEVVECESHFHVNNAHVAKKMARDGFGAALVIGSDAERDIAEATLKPVSARYRFGYVSVRIMMRDRLPSPQAIAFRDFVLSPLETAAQAVERPVEPVPPRQEPEPEAPVRKRELPDWML